MAIPVNSRYNQGYYTRMPNAAGQYNLSVLRSVPPAVSDFYLYIWRSGDRPDNVAANLLGDPQLWWAIFDINPELIYPLNIPPGSVIRIPSSPVMGQGTLVQ